MPAAAELVIKAPEGLSFDARRHRYTLRGVALPSVTTVLNVLDKPALAQWRVDQAVEAMRSAWSPDKPYTEGERDALLNGSRFAWRAVSGAAASKGKLAHEWIERHVYGTKQPDPTDPEVHAATNAFLEWEASHDVEYLEHELAVADPVHGYAGTLDSLIRYDGKIALLDLKTSKGIYAEYYLQLAAYEGALATMLKKGKLDKRLIVRIPKDGGPVEVVTVERDVKADIRAFLGALELYRWSKGNGD